MTEINREKESSNEREEEGKGGEGGGGVEGGKNGKRTLEKKKVGALFLVWPLLVQKAALTVWRF